MSRRRQELVQLSPSLRTVRETQLVTQLIFLPFSNIKIFTAAELRLGSVFTGFVLIGQRGATMGGEVLASVYTAPTT